MKLFVGLMIALMLMVFGTFVYLIQYDALYKNYCYRYANEVDYNVDTYKSCMELGRYLVRLKVLKEAYPLPSGEE